MNHSRYEIDKAKTKYSTIYINDSINFDLDNTDKKEANSHKRCHEGKLLNIDTSLTCLLKIKYTKKSFSS